MVCATGGQGWRRDVLVATLFAASVLGGACSSRDEIRNPVDLGVDDGATDPDQRAADGPADGAPLDVRGDSLAPDSGPRPPARWDVAAPMGTARSWHTATLLKDGTVLVAGGLDVNTVHKSAQRYHPSTNSWSPAGEMSTAHWAHTATLLDDGRVLIVAGCGASPAVTCMIGIGAEIYDPTVTSGSPWSNTGPLLAVRRSHCATKLLDGRVLIAGGFDNQKNHRSIEIFDPSSGNWTSPTAVLSTERNLATATTLKSGKVVFIGGSTGSVELDTLDLFDPGTGLVTTLPNKLKGPRFMHTATLLDDGRVLLVGGDCDDTAGGCEIKQAEIFDPSSGKVIAAGSTGTALLGHATQRLGNGNVLVTGGFVTLKEARLYTVNPASWGQTAALNAERRNHTLTLLPGGKVLATGGGPGVFEGSTAVEIYTP